jgi:hypothetical protein
MSLPKNWKNQGWIDICSDVNWQDYHGLWGIRIDMGEWYLIKFTNMAEHFSEEELKEYPQFEAQVLYVNLNDIDKKELKNACDCCGYGNSDWNHGHVPIGNELMMINACASYGTAANLDTVESNVHALRVRASAKRIVEAYIADKDSLEDELDKPMNAIGTTKREQAKGNILGGLERYAVDLSCGTEDPNTEGNQRKNLMLKLYGVNTESLIPQSNK